MLILYTGFKARDARKQVLAQPESGTMVVVPDEISRKGLEQVCGWPAGVGTRLLDFETLLVQITRGSQVGWPEPVAPEHVCRAVIRNLLESAPKDFDYLVGRHSVPRLTQDVLSRIVGAVNALVSGVAETEEMTAGQSPRMRQLRLLARRFEDRLATHGFMREKAAIWQAIIAAGPGHWREVYPEIRRLVFVDFFEFSDEIVLSLAALSKVTETCEVLLDFSPERDVVAGTPLEMAYQRLYDMADQVNTDDGFVGTGDEDAASETMASSSAAVIADVDTVSDEINSIAALASVVVRPDDGAGVDSLRPLFVYAIANPEKYASGLESALAGHGLSLQWIREEALHRGPEFLLLDRLQQCVIGNVAGASVAKLFRSPGFCNLLGGNFATVEVWDLASRLDYTLAFTGQVTGWPSLVKSTREMLHNLQERRKWNKQWTADEKALDDRLLELLGITQKLAGQYGGARSIAEWAEFTAAILEKIATQTGASDERPPDQWVRLMGVRGKRLQEVLIDLASAQAVLSSAAVDFAAFLSCFRTAVYNLRVVDTTVLDGRGGVLACSPEIAQKLEPDYCCVPGFNDGNLPRFGRPDASFLSRDYHLSQKILRERQWQTVERLARKGRQSWFFVPKHEGTEELLPSQFIDRLQGGRGPSANGEAFHPAAAETQTAIRTTAGAVLRKNRAAGRGRVAIAQTEMAEALRGLELSDSEVRRFAARGEAVFNIANGIAVQTSRSRSQLSAHDGIITDPQLKQWLASWVDRHTFSVSQLDGIVGCSFRFFADRLLNLEQIDEADGLLPAHLFGSFAHDVLAVFYRNWVLAGRGTLRSSDEALAREELARAYHAKYDPGEDLSEFARDLMKLKLFGELGPERFGSNDTALEDVGDPGIFGTFLLLEMARGDDPAMDFLHPANFEVGFGMEPEDDDDPLSTPDCVVMDVGGGNSVRLFGRIDRIDVSSTGVFAVTDYKTGHLPRGTEIAGGFRTQLPIYMLVAQQLLSGHFEAPVPAGGLYYALRRGKAARVSAAFVRAAFQQQLGVTGRGMTDDKFESTLLMVRSRIRESMNALRNGHLTTTRHSPDTVCAYCAFEPLCYRNVERTSAFWEEQFSRDISEADAEDDVVGVQMEQRKGRGSR